MGWDREIASWAVGEDKIWERRGVLGIVLLSSQRKCQLIISLLTLLADVSRDDGERRRKRRKGE
jgi:hypothetical protein